MTDNFHATPKFVFEITGFTIYDLDSETKDTISILHICINPKNIFLNADGTITVHLNINDDKSIIDEIKQNAYYIFDFDKDKKQFYLKTKEICKCINTVYFTFYN